MNSNNISLAGLNPDLKDKLISGKTLISTAIGALGAFTILSAMDVKNTEIHSENESNSDTSSDTIGFNSHALFGKASNETSFSEAFGEQRSALGPGGIFEYKGKYYNTFLKEEWDSMTASQKQDYYKTIEHVIDYSSVTYNSVAQNEKINVIFDIYIDPETGDISISTEYPHDKVNLEYNILQNDEKLDNDAYRDFDEPENTVVNSTESVNEVYTNENEDNPPDPDFIIDEGTGPVKSFLNEDYIDPSDVKILEEDNIADPSDIRIIDDEDNMVEPELFDDSDNLQDPSFTDINSVSGPDNIMGNSGDEIANIENDFDF